MTDDLAQARKMLYNLLLAPYHESSHYQITSACVYLEHPMRPSGKRCICGMKDGMVQIGENEYIQGSTSTAQLDAQDHAGTR